MTAEQASVLIEQQKQLLDLYGLILPFLTQIIREVFPPFAVGSAAFLGLLFARSAT